MLIADVRGQNRMDVDNVETSRCNVSMARVVQQ
jgi:hypothetical protein